MTRLRLLLAVLFSVVGVSGLAAQELGEVQTPTAKPVTSYKVVRIEMATTPTPRFVIGYEDNFGNAFTDEHVGDCVPPVIGGEPMPNAKCASNLIMEFNIGDFGTDSMVRRALQHLMDEKAIPPVTITGTPPLPVTPVTAFGRKPTATKTPVKPTTPVKKEHP
jgi:hypothetical protein